MNETACACPGLCESQARLSQLFPPLPPHLLPGLKAREDESSPAGGPSLISHLFKGVCRHPRARTQSAATGLCRSQKQALIKRKVNELYLRRQKTEDAATLNLAWNPSALPASQDGPGGCGHTHRLRSSVGCFKTNKVSYNRSGGQKHAMVSELFGVATYSEMLPPPTSSSSSF